MGRPRAQQPQVKRPSPLHQVHTTRPLSQSPESEAAPPAAGLVRDPQFWKRFSTAVHRAEVEQDVEQGSQKSGKSSVNSRDEWLAQQHREKIRCRKLCAAITGVVILGIALVAIVCWYFMVGRYEESS